MPNTELHREEVMAQSLFFVWMGFLLYFLPSARSRVVFLLVSHGVAGLLQVQITLSHFSMPVNQGLKDERGAYGGDFYTRNIEASMDIRCSPAMDWFHGGLQFQTLHHCFPRLSRRHLRKTQAFIKELCRIHDIKYTEYGFVEGNIDVIKCLHRAATDAKTWSPKIWESVNAEG